MLVLLIPQFVGVVMEESSFQVEISAYVDTGPAKHYSETLQLIIAIPILLFATVGLFLVLYMHHSWGVVGTVLAQSQVARHTMRSTMLTSWGLLLVLVWWEVSRYLTSSVYLFYSALYLTVSP